MTSKPSHRLMIVLGLASALGLGVLLTVVRKPQSSFPTEVDINNIISKDSDPAYRTALTGLACSPESGGFCLKQAGIAGIRKLNFSLAASPYMGSNVIEINPSKHTVTVNTHLNKFHRAVVLNQAFSYINDMSQENLPLTRVCFTAGYNGSSGLSFLPGNCPPTNGSSPS